MKDYIVINKNRKAHCTHTKYTIYIDKRKKGISNTVLIKVRSLGFSVYRYIHIDVRL